MISSRELLAAARAAQGIPSNYRLARVLDVPERSVQRWNTGKNTPDDPVAVKLAEMAGLDPAMVLASMYAQRATDGPMQSVWETIARRAQTAAAALSAATLSVLAMTVPDGVAQAATRSGAVVPTQVLDANSLYIVVCSLLRLAARALLRRLQPHTLTGAFANP